MYLMLKKQKNGKMLGKMVKNLTYSQKIKFITGGKKVPYGIMKFINFNKVEDNLEIWKGEKRVAKEGDFIIKDKKMVKLDYQDINKVIFVWKRVQQIGIYKIKKNKSNRRGIRE